MARMRRLTSLLILLLCAGCALAQGPQNVLLVVNTNAKVSTSIGEYYAKRRGIPSRQVCAIQAPDREEIERSVFDSQVQTPIARCIAERGLFDQVFYIVLTKGVPLKVDGSGGREAVRASVDSELALLYSSLMGVRTTLAGKVPNPYYTAHASGRFVRFSHRLFYIYLVTRLDGYDEADIRALIDRAQEPSRDGRFVLDLHADNAETGNNWLRGAAQKLADSGIDSSRIRLDTSPEMLTGEKNVLGYYSWGSNDPTARSRFTRNTWAKGALMAEYVSSDARTFEKPPDTWNIGSWKDPKAMFNGSPQSLIGDYIHEGVMGAAGHAYEPYLDACVRPQLLFPAYVRGLNLAESYYAAMPYLSWQTVVVGDPLASAFPGQPLPMAEIYPATEPVTGLPVFFAGRLVGLRAKASGESAQASALVIGAERKLQAGDHAGAAALLQQAAALDPPSPSALLLMAADEERAGRGPAAEELYRRILKVRPNHALALNNLAYRLATDGRAAEALPLARRALEIAGERSAALLDTYGWVLYQLDKQAEALPYLQKAVAADAGDASTLFHLGMCLNKLGRAAEARQHLEKALTLKPDPATQAAIQKALGRN